MAEYIEREEAKDVMALIVLEAIVHPDTYTCGEAKRAIESIHTADVRPVLKGIWEKQDTNLVWNAVGLYAAAYKCNRCGKLNIAETHFCPNCGAQMIGGDDDG